MFVPLGTLLSLMALTGAVAAEPPEASAVEVACDAVPNDGADDTAALGAALAEAHERGRARIRLEPGRYDLVAPDGGDGDALLRAEGLDELVIDGGGAEWIVDGWALPFQARDCNRVVLKNLVIDWKEAPFTCGEVVAAADTHFDVEAFDEFPVRDGQTVKVVIEFDPETRMPAGDGVDAHDAVDRTEKIGPRRLRVYTTRPLPVRVGRYVTLCHTWYGPGALSFRDCREVVLEDVTIYTAPGMGLVAGRCGDMLLERFQVRVRPDTDRLMSVTADASHFGGCTGTIRIEDSLFDGNGDDAANIKAGLYLAVTEKIDERTVRARHRMGLPNPPRPGDRIEILRPDTLLPSGEATVEHVEMERGGVHRIVWAEPLPETLQVGDLLGNLSTVPRVEIRRCTVRNSRARGFLLQSRGVLVEDCYFEHCTHGGISIITEVASFGESITSRDVVVRRNRFHEVNAFPGSTFGVIGVISFLEGFARPPYPGVHRNIAIEDNEIRGTAVAAIYACGVEGLVVRGNTVEEACRNPVRDGEREAIYLEASGPVTVEGNRVDLDKQGPGCKDALGLGPGCDPSAIVVRDNIGFP